jgi:tryptophan synthase alpha subunit
MDTAQFKNLQAKLESIWNEDSFIVNDAPVEEADETEGYLNKYQIRLHKT